VPVWIQSKNESQNVSQLWMKGLLARTTPFECQC
jgi:hypothetical protein